MQSTGSSSNHHTSPSLLARVRSDDAAAWRELVDLYAPLVASWCRQRGLGPEDTSDVMQNIFMSVARGLQDFRHDAGREGSFRAWLWTISRNRIIDHARRQHADQATGGSSAALRMSRTADCIGDDPEPTSQLDLHHLMRRALGQIEATVAPRSWQAFWRTVVDCQPTDLVAVELKMSPAAIRQARSRVLRRLREQLGDCQSG